MFWALILFYVNILKKFFSGNSRVRLHAYFIAYLWARIVKRPRPPRFRMKRVSVAVGMLLHSERIIKKFYLQHFLRSCVAHSASSFRHTSPPATPPPAYTIPMDMRTTLFISGFIIKSRTQSGFVHSIWCTVWISTECTSCTG